MPNPRENKPSENQPEMSRFSKLLRRMKRTDKEVPFSITERIRNADGEVLGVSRYDIEQELTRFSEERNADELLEMFDAYLDWEIRMSPHTSLEKVSKRAMGNFDLVAKVADIRKLYERDEDHPVLKEVSEHSTSVVGPIRQFYRETVGYHPEPPIDPSLN